MSSYVITGVSRGIGVRSHPAICVRLVANEEPIIKFEFVRQLSENPANTVFGLVRNKAAVESKVATEIGRKNIHIIQADTTDPEALKVG